METDELTVRCVCGWQTTGAEEVVIEATREHGQLVHNMTASRDQILAMAVPVSDVLDPTHPGRRR